MLSFSHAAIADDFAVTKIKYKFCNKINEYNGTKVSRENECNVYNNLLREFANKDDADAQNELGFMFNMGDIVFVGIKKDEYEACSLWKKATELGNAQAMWRLGHCYETGTGMLQDYAEALKFYRASSMLGEARAIRFLANFYADGKALSPNQVLAYVWYSLATEKLIRTGYENQAEEDKNKRDQIASNLDNAKILAAQAIAKQCLISNYKECGD